MKTFISFNTQRGKLSANRLSTAQLAGFVFLSLALTSPLQANFINPGSVPVPPGPPPVTPPTFTETYTYTPSAGKAITFTITVVPGETAEDKADAIVAAINDPTGPVKGAASRANNINHPEQVNSAGTIALVTSTSGEKDKILALGPVLPGSFITVAYGGTLTGTTYDGGAPSTFFAAFGYDGVSTQSSVAYNLLPHQTVDGVMTATYNNLLAGLPSALQSSLTLSLSTDTIRFALPGGATNPFVVGNSLDQSLSYGESLVTATPEPSSLYMMGMGLFCALVSAFRLRRTGSTGV